MRKRIRILIADDSSLFTEALTELLERHPDISVAGVARTGIEAVKMVAKLRPDLVTMDVHMPEMDGLEAVERIMAEQPTPIMVLTADKNSHDQSWCFEALQRGALDLMGKPDIDAIYEQSGAEFCERLNFLARVPVIHHPRKRTPIRTLTAPTQSRPEHLPAAIGIVASTGGPSALAEVLGTLPANYPLPIVVVQHLAAGFAPHLAQWLGDICALEVRIADPTSVLEPGVVYLAPEDRHLRVGTLGKLSLTRNIDDAHCPSGDQLLASLAGTFRERAVGIVLTGMGADGSRGLLKIRKHHGVTIAQDGDSSIVDGMPKAARQNGAAREVLPLTEISPALLRHAMAFASERSRSTS